MFRIISEPIDPQALKAELLDPHAGACVTFGGWVRNHNEGKPVQALDYEAYTQLADAEGERILVEAREKFAVQSIVCRHRVGTLLIGDLAVWAGVSSAHRGAAFDACRYVIDEVKARVPIWKKEHYTDGVSEWINCAIRGAGTNSPPI